MMKRRYTPHYVPAIDPRVVRHQRSERGCGQLEVPGQEPLTLPYQIEIGDQITEDSRGGRTLAHRRIVGRVIPLEAWTLVPYVGAATLVLEDGRRWGCLVVDIDGQLVNGAAEPPFD